MSAMCPLQTVNFPKNKRQLVFAGLEMPNSSLYFSTITGNDCALDTLAIYK